MEGGLNLRLCPGRSAQFELKLGLTTVTQEVIPRLVDDPLLMSAADVHVNAIELAARGGFLGSTDARL